MDSVSKFRLRRFWAEISFSQTSVAQGVQSTLWFVAGVICVRRLMGGFAPPDSPVLALFAWLSFALAGGWLFWWMSSVERSSVGDPRLQGFAALLPGFLLGWSLLPAGEIFGMALLIAGTTVALCGVNWHLEALAISADLAELNDRIDSDVPTSAAGEVDALTWFQPPADESAFVANEVFSDDAPEMPGDGVTLWMKRQRDAEGCDSLEGATKVEFVADQKLAVVHLCFFPSFAGTPEMECEILDEGSFHIRPAAVYPYGARVEVQRSAPLDEPAVAELGFFARMPRDELSSAA